MKRDLVPFFLRASWVIASALLLTLCSSISPAHAAKMYVRWVAPMTNTDDTVLVDLVGYRIEWGSCTSAGAFLVYQAGINVGAQATSSPIYPTNLSVVCVRLYAINSQHALSDPGYASSPISLPTLGQPIH